MRPKTALCNAVAPLCKTPRRATLGTNTMALGAGQIKPRSAAARPAQSEAAAERVQDPMSRA